MKSIKGRGMYEVRTMFLHMDLYEKASLISVSLPKSHCPISPSFLDARPTPPLKQLTDWFTLPSRIVTVPLKA